MCRSNQIGLSFDLEPTFRLNVCLPNTHPNIFPISFNLFYIYVSSQIEP